MKKFIIILSVIIFLMTGCSNNERDKFENENKKLSKKISEYKTTIENFKEVSGFDIISFTATKTCEFTKTYKVYKMLGDYVSTGTIDKKYIILSAFQSEKLILVKIVNEMFHNLKEGNFYEFKFNGSKNYRISTINDEYIFDNFNVISIIETSKVGLEQVNDNIMCK